MNVVPYSKAGIEFDFIKLELNTIYNTYSNESPFRYHISVK